MNSPTFTYQFTSFDQNVSEVFGPKYMKTDAVDFLVTEEVQTTERVSTSRLAVGSEKSTIPAFCASSSCTNTAITEASKMLVSLTRLLRHWRPMIL